MYSYASLCRALATTDAPQEEACLLLAHFCGVGRAELLCDRDRLYGNDALDAAVLQRLTGYPLQYILGEWYFFGCRFRVSPACLIPRPDTEVLVEAGLERAEKGSLHRQRMYCDRPAGQPPRHRPVRRIGAVP